MKYRINIHDLYTYIETNVSEQSNFIFRDDLCEDNSSYELNVVTDKIRSLDKTISLFFNLEKEFEDQGYYSSLDELPPTVDNTNISDDYIVSAQTDSRLFLVRSLDGSYVLNLNFSTVDNKFTGVIEKTDDYILYVINADLQDGILLNKTGVYYSTLLIDGSTTAFYYPKFFNNTGANTSNDFFYKEEHTHKWASDKTIFSQVFIDRGSIVDPQGKHEVIQMYNNLTDIEDFV